jgi:hypothetical protein
VKRGVNMKKLFFCFVFVLLLFLLSGCMFFTNFEKTVSLAENAIRSGSGTNALNYAEEALNIAQNDEQKSKAFMLKGYAHYLLAQYSSASSSFGSSLNYSANYDSYSGKILSLFMLGSNSLLPEYIDELNSFPELWSFTLNKDIINKGKLYEAIALSASLLKNQTAFSQVKNKIDSDLAVKMEAFFNE